MRFSFDANEHEYVELATGIVLPHITGLLERAGWIDSEWYTDECKVRGSAVHRMTADYDLGAIDSPDDVTSAYKGWLLAHVKAMTIIPHDWTHVEVPMAHDRFRFGGRPDRVGKVYGAVSDVEVKSGDPEKSHGIQTALQCILIAQESPLPPEAITRYGLYLKPNGRFKLEEFPDRKDYDEAFRILHKYCEVAA